MKHPLKLPSVAITAATLILMGAPAFFRTTSAQEAEVAPPAVGATATANQALFTAFVAVLRHPRCLNCHSRGDFPRQGDDGHQHTMDIRRGPDGHGVTAQKCSACHQDYNLVGSHMPPGAPNWRLPPRDMPMIWQGLTDAQICRSIKNPKENNNRKVDQIVGHLTEDDLVLWASTPGEGRDPIPMPHEEFVARVKRWQAAGAPRPPDTGSRKP